MLHPLVEVNVALHKPAQLSTVHTSYAFANGISAVDGNRNQLFLGQSCTHSDANADEEPWWEVDLGKAFFVKSVQITNRLGKYQHLPW